MSHCICREKEFGYISETLSSLQGHIVICCSGGVVFFYGRREVQNSLYSITQDWVKRIQDDQCESCMEVRYNWAKSQSQAWTLERKTLTSLPHGWQLRQILGCLLLRKHLLFPWEGQARSSSVESGKAQNGWLRLDVVLTRAGKYREDMSSFSLLIPWQPLVISHRSFLLHNQSTWMLQASISIGFY